MVKMLFTTILKLLVKVATPVNLNLCGSFRVKKKRAQMRTMSKCDAFYTHCKLTHVHSGAVKRNKGDCYSLSD